MEENFFFSKEDKKSTGKKGKDCRKCVLRKGKSAGKRIGCGGDREAGREKRGDSWQREWKRSVKGRNKEGYTRGTCLTPISPFL